MDFSKIIDNPRYSIHSALGEGGMGAVYLALDIKLNRKVAIKVIRGDIPKDESIIKRTKTEGLILSKLEHPSLARIYEMNMMAKRPYIVQEYIEGQDLKSIIENGNFLSEELALRLFIEQADVIAYLHKQSIVHRDIKPANIMIDKNGKSVLMDFGLALSDEYTRVTREGNYVGTMTYCPPEVLQGKDSGPYSDVYQLGLVAYEVMTGLSFIGKFKTVNHFITKLAERSWEDAPLDPRVTGKLAAVIRNSCRYNFKERSADGTALLKLLKKKGPINEERSTEITSPREIEKASRSVNKVPPTTPRRASLRKSKKNRVVNTHSKSSDHKRISSSHEDDKISSKKFPLQLKKIKSRKMIVGMAAIFIGLLLFISHQVISNKNGVWTGTDSDSENQSTIESAKAFVMTPGGFYLFLPTGTVNNLNWKLESDEPLKEGENVVKGTFTRIAGGWKAFENTLTCALGTEATITIFDGDERLDRRDIIIPESMFKTPFSAFFGYDQISADWSFNGHSPATIKITNQLTGKELYKKEVNKESFDVHFSSLNYNGPLKISLSIPCKGLKEKDIPLPQANRGIYGLKHGSNDMSIVLQLASSSGERSTESRSYIKLVASHFSGKILDAAMEGNLLYIPTKNGELMCFEVDPKNQPPTRLVWQKSFSEIASLKKYKSPKSLHYPPELATGTIIPTKNGVDCYSLGDGSNVFSFTKDGNVSEKNVPIFKWWNDPKLKPQLTRAVAPMDTPAGQLIKWGGTREKRIFIEDKKTKSISLLKADSKHNWVRFWFHGFDTVFFYTMEDLSQRLSVLEKSKGKHTLKEIMYVPKPDHTYDKARMAYDKELKVAIFIMNGLFYELRRKEGNYIHKRIPFPLPRATTIRELTSLGNGRFVGIALTGISDKLFGVSNNLDLSIINIQVDPETGEISTSLHQTGEKLITDTDLSRTIPPTILNKGRICFTGGISFYIFSEDLNNLVFKKTMEASMDKVFIKENYVLGVNKRQSKIYMMNYNPLNN